MSMVNNEAEPFVREAFNAVVAQDRDRLQRALNMIPDHVSAPALQLAMAVDAEAVAQLFEGRPDASQLDALATEFMAMEDWFVSTDLPVKDFFRVLGGVEVPGDLPAEAAALLTFLVGGWLLSAFLTDGKDWYEYLDQLLNVLERPRTTGA